MNAPAVSGQLYDTYLTIRNDLYQMQYAEVLKVVAELDLSAKEKREIQSHPIKFGHQFPFYHPSHQVWLRSCLTLKHTVRMEALGVFP